MFMQMSSLVKICCISASRNTLETTHFDIGCNNLKHAF
jgi:hypothetical protein